MKFDPKSSAIIFKNWRIYAPIATIAQQYDSYSRSLRVDGNMPDGYRWDMFVQCGENRDIIPLIDQPVTLNETYEEEPSNTRSVSAILTADQLSKSGLYELQLRGTLLADPTVIRHTNVITVRIPKTIIGDGVWPEIPTSFTDIEQSILEANAHPPIPGENGYWKIWDTVKDEYVVSSYPLPSVSPGASITDVSVSEDGELLVQYSDGSIKNLGSIAGQDGAVYVPHISDRKVLSFTIEEEPQGVPDPVDLNPNDEWGDIDGGSTDYVWEEI